jgi:uncharacterized membrane protein
MKVMKRDISIDIFRGLAIFTMTAANMAGGLLEEPHPFLFRFYGSFAAPIFIILAGMMVSITSHREEHNFSYYLKRGFLIMLTGAFIDTCIWQIYPFTGVDVLYLIGFSIPIAYVFKKLEKKVQIITIVIIFVLTPILQKIIGYAGYPVSIRLTSEFSVLWSNSSSILKAWVIDGWFPIFPWLGFSLTGVFLANFRDIGKFVNKKIRKQIFYFSISILSAGIIIWQLFPGPLLTREGYSELFYPPTVGYICCAIGAAILILFIIDSKPHLNIFAPLRAMGESSLFFYILHLVLIGFAINFNFSTKDFLLFLSLYVGLSFLLFIAAFVLRKFKQNWKNKPFLVRFLLGT